MTGSLWRQNWPCNLVLRTQKKKEKLSAHLCSKIASISFFIFAVSSRLKFIFPTSCWHSILLYIRTEIDISYMLLTFHFTIYLDWNWCFPKSCWHSMLLYIWTEIDVSHKLLKLMFPTSSWHSILLYIQTEIDVSHKLLTLHVTIYRDWNWCFPQVADISCYYLSDWNLCFQQAAEIPCYYSHDLHSPATELSTSTLKNVCLTSFSSPVEKCVLDLILFSSSHKRSTWSGGLTISSLHFFNSCHSCWVSWDK